MQEKTINLHEVRQAYESFPQQFDSLLMATVNEAGTPDASYAAYVQDGGDYYVYISELSLHTRNLAQTGAASILFIENEQQAQHLFARQRVTYQCETYQVERTSAQFEHIMSLFARKFGNIIEMLKNLQDFHLYCIHPLQGSFVQGFGRAFAIEGEVLESIRHLNESGHRGAGKRSPEQLAEAVNE